jgi:hypothetical protein
MSNSTDSTDDKVIFIQSPRQEGKCYSCYYRDKGCDDTQKCSNPNGYYSTTRIAYLNR